MWKWLLKGVYKSANVEIIATLGVYFRIFSTKGMNVFEYSFNNSYDMGRQFFGLKF